MCQKSSLLSLAQWDFPPAIAVKALQHKDFAEFNLNHMKY